MQLESFFINKNLNLSEVSTAFLFYFSRKITEKKAYKNLLSN